MKTLCFISTALPLLLCSAAVAQQTAVDRITIANGKKLHFQITTGRPDDIILFEAGGGDDVRVWNGLLAPIAQATGATLIAYDRPGFGSSEVDPENHGLVGDMERLEAGLKELGYTGHYTLVAHSLGGFYATLFASRHPEEVRAAVMLDINLACYFTDTFLPKIRTSPSELESYRETNPGRYYFSLDYEPMARAMRSVSFPKTIPVIDFVSDRRAFPSPEDADRWRSCHAAFAAEAPNRTENTAYGTGHYIFQSNPELTIAAILQAHAIANGRSSPELAYAVNALNEEKRKDAQFARSEEGLNQWGYDLLRSGRIEDAVKVFELNTRLRPNSSNAFDSLGEGCEAAGDRDAAIRNYSAALKLDPTAKHAAERIRLLSSPN
jgi:pimeloyl-ACP methyl ester carboxylesterase